MQEEKMQDDIKGHLIIIGGAEDKQGECIILKQALQMLSNNEQLTILTTATENPKEVGDIYQGVFGRIGAKNIKILDINSRDDANNEEMCGVIRASKCIFFTGGDQLRITSILGGTSAYKELKP
jgi:cyanophycinase